VVAAEDVVVHPCRTGLFEVNRGRNPVGLL
jgi:hypothetical protein